MDALSGTASDGSDTECFITWVNHEKLIESHGNYTEGQYLKVFVFYTDVIIERVSIQSIYF